MNTRPQGPNTNDRIEVEVFPTGSTTARAPDGSEDAGVDDQTRRGGALMRDGYDHVRDIQARPGHRLGTPIEPAPSGRRGGPADIVRPVLVNPILATEFAISGELFTDAVPHLDIERWDDDGRRFLVWAATVHREHRHCVPATLHLLASPSMVVTVLELVPSRQVRWGCDRFVHDGIAAMEVLARRLEQCSSTAAA